MPYTIMRPTVIEGPEDPHRRSLFFIQRLQDGGPIIIPTSESQTLYKHVFSDDVAQAFLLAVGNEHAYNQIYNVAGEQTLSIKDYIENWGFLLGKESIDLCWLENLDLNRELPQYHLPLFFEQVRLMSNIEKIKHELGYKPTNTLDWMQKTLTAFQNSKEFSPGYQDRKEEKRVANKHQPQVLQSIMAFN